MEAGKRSIAGENASILDGGKKKASKYMYRQRRSALPGRSSIHSFPTSPHPASSTASHLNLNLVTLRALRHGKVTSAAAFLCDRPLLNRGLSLRHLIPFCPIPPSFFPNRASFLPQSVVTARQFGFPSRKPTHQHPSVTPRGLRSAIAFAASIPPTKQLPHT